MYNDAKSGGSEHIPWTCFHSRQTHGTFSPQLLRNKREGVTRVLLSRVLYGWVRGVVAILYDRHAVRTSRQKKQKQKKACSGVELLWIHWLFLCLPSDNVHAALCASTLITHKHSRKEKQRKPTHGVYLPSERTGTSGLNCYLLQLRVFFRRRCHRWMDGYIHPRRTIITPFSIWKCAFPSENVHFHLKMSISIWKCAACRYHSSVCVFVMIPI